MKSIPSIIVWMMVISIFLKLLVYTANWQFTDYEKVYLFGNFFVMMWGIYSGIRLFKKNAAETTVYLADLKAGMRIASVYALIMSAFIYIYYSQIDTQYFEQKIQERIELTIKQGEDIEQAKKSMEMVSTPFFQSTLTLIGFLILGSFYSAMLAFLIRRISRER